MVEAGAVYCLSTGCNIAGRGRAWLFLVGIRRDIVSFLLLFFLRWMNLLRFEIYSCVSRPCELEIYVCGGVVFFLCFSVQSSGPGISSIVETCRPFQD